MRPAVAISSVVLFSLALGLSSLRGAAPTGSAAEPTAPAEETAPAATPPAGDADDPSAEARYETVALSGRVVWMAEALQRRFGIRSDDDAARRLVAIETTDGQLWPIVKDGRGRGFLKDPRLLGQPMEIVVRRFHGSPMVQVIKVHTLKESGKFILDYWCDICAIPMYELKECECCQGPIRLRERPVKAAGP